MQLIIDTSGLEKLTKALGNVSEKVSKDVAKTAAADFEAYLVLHTPVDTGKLRAAWNIKAPKKHRNSYTVDVLNNVHYLWPVNNGHVTRMKKDGTRGYVAGQFFVERSVKLLRKSIPDTASAAFRKLFRDGMR